MRNLKKVLSLALAFVMLLGMMVVGAGAAVTTTKDYADAASVTYTEAVDVMSAIGVFNGTDSGFSPNGDLTRAQAAKIITYMLLGQEAADKLGTLTAPFNDVPANNWAAGSIAYCSNMGIVAGNGKGNFNPNNTVTGFEFAKMLLVALGYDADREGLTGSGWSINVSRLAITAAGLDTGIGNIGISLDKNLNREEAAQMAFNALKATMVEYGTNASTITVGNTPIVIGGSNATAVLVVNQAYGNHFSGLGGTTSKTIEFGERYFQNLYCIGDTDSMGRPSHTWQINREDIGTYANTSVFTYTNDCKTGANKTALENTLRSYNFVKNSVGAPLYVNGLPSGTVVNAGEVADQTGNGVLVEIFADDSRDVTAVVVINTYLMSVKKITADEVTLSKVGSGNNQTVEAVKKDEATYAALSAMKVDDYVLVTPVYDNREDSQGNAIYVVDAVAAPEMVSGALSRVDKNKGATTAVTVAGSSYSVALNRTGVGNITLNDLTNANLTATTKKDAILYLDSYGYAVLIKDVEAVANYMYITSTYQNLVNNKVVTMVRGVSASGEMVEINVGSLSGDNPSQSVVAGSDPLVRYNAADTNTSNLYGAEFTITAVPKDNDSSYTAGEYVDAKSIAMESFHTHLNNEPRAPFAGNVKFIYIDPTTKAVTVLDGVQKKAAGAEDTRALMIQNTAGNTVVGAVFIAAEAPDSVGANILYVTAYKGAYTVNNSAVTMWEVLIDGEKKTINVKGAPTLHTADNTATAGEIVLNHFYSYGYDEANDLYTVKTDEFYNKTDKTNSIKQATLLGVVDNRLLRFADAPTYLDAGSSDVVVVDLRQGGKVDSIKELAEQLLPGVQVGVSVIYNGDANSAKKNTVSYVYITDGTVPTGPVNSTISKLDNTTPGVSVATGNVTINKVTSGGGSTGTTVTLTGDAVTTLTAGGRDLTIQSDNGTVIVPKEAFGDGGELKTTSSSLKVEVAPASTQGIDTGEGNTNVVAFELTVTRDGTAVTNWTNAVTYTKQLAANLGTVKVYRVNGESYVEVKNDQGSVSYNNDTGLLTVTLNHLSTFVVVEAEEEQEGPGGDENVSVTKVMVNTVQATGDMTNGYTAEIATIAKGATITVTPTVSNGTVETIKVGETKITAQAPYTVGENAKANDTIEFKVTVTPTAQGAQNVTFTVTVTLKAVTGAQQGGTITLGDVTYTTEATGGLTATAPVVKESGTEVSKGGTLSTEKTYTIEVAINGTPTGAVKVTLSGDGVEATSTTATGASNGQTITDDSATATLFTIPQTADLSQNSGTITFTFTVEANQDGADVVVKPTITLEAVVTP